ncbi:unnamed protein product [Brugia pahangi]|uniref:Transmembrane protein n=1 Tax=Brugia pahangi TaxID=6280 RepID=A0A0N4TVS6_BRUPA|nr:unnamed protein product [Brugia pahangi]
MLQRLWPMTQLLPYTAHNKPERLAGALFGCWKALLLICPLISASYFMLLESVKRSLRVWHLKRKNRLLRIDIDCSDFVLCPIICTHVRLVVVKCLLTTNYRKKGDDFLIVIDVLKLPNIDNSAINHCCISQFCDVNVKHPINMSSCIDYGLEQNARVLPRSLQLAVVLMPVNIG